MFVYSLFGNLCCKTNFKVHKYFKVRIVTVLLFLSIQIRLLRGLAIFDALFLLVAILVFGLPKLSNWYNENFMVIMVICFGLLHTFRVGSVYVTLAVTFERFHAIASPLKKDFR